MQRHRNLDIPRSLDDVCDPERLALIVYDMQVGVVGQIDDGDRITGRVLEVLEAARRVGVRTFFTRHMSLPLELMGIAQLRMAMAWQRKDRVEEVGSPFLRDSPGFELVPDLAPRDSEAIEEMTAAAFGPDRLHKTVYRLREDVAPIKDLCFVCLDQKGRLVASIRNWPVLINDKWPAVMLGPLAIAPETSACTSVPCWVTARPMSCAVDPCCQPRNSQPFGPLVRATV